MMSGCRGGISTERLGCVVGLRLRAAVHGWSGSKGRVGFGAARFGWLLRMGFDGMGFVR